MCNACENRDRKEVNCNCSFHNWAGYWFDVPDGFDHSSIGKDSLCAVIVIGTSESQNISCSTGSSKNTHGLQFSAHTRTGTLNGYWDIASAFTGAENKGGYVYEGRSDGKTYELKVKETQDGICHAEVPKDVVISGNCGKGSCSVQDH